MKIPAKIPLLWCLSAASLPASAGYATAEPITIARKNIPGAEKEAPGLFGSQIPQLTEEFAGLPVNGPGITSFSRSNSFTAEMLFESVRAFNRLKEKQLNESVWVNKRIPGRLFVRKLIVPERAEVSFRGDLHGDIHSFVSWLKTLRTKGWFDSSGSLKIVKKNSYIVFLGDYSDRGHYGSEVLFLITQLSLYNPDRVIAVRGNHEDYRLAENYGFKREILRKFPEKALIRQLARESIKGPPASGLRDSSLFRMYDYLPVAALIGAGGGKRNSFVLACHGGMDRSHNLSGLLSHASPGAFQSLAEQTSVAEYQWNDFDFFNESPGKLFSPNVRRGGGYIIHQTGSSSLMKQTPPENHLKAVFRAHQHSGGTIPHILKYGNGVYRLWDAGVTKAGQFGQLQGSQNQQWTGKEGEGIHPGLYSVWTFNVAPRTGAYEVSVPDFNYDTAGILKMHRDFSKWMLFPVKIPAARHSVARL